VARIPHLIEGSSSCALTQSDDKRGLIDALVSACSFLSTDDCSDEALRFVVGTDNGCTKVCVLVSSRECCYDENLLIVVGANAMC
jgi:hypothetical protein